MRQCNRHPGFTLIELLVVVSIIALLISLLLPALSTARASAYATTCLSNHKQTTLALINYSTEHKGRLMHFAQREDDGLQWWFGFESGGPSTGSNRPLDKTRGPLARYLGEDIHQVLACPGFPEDDAGFSRKFAERSAHFGYNGALAHPFPIGATPRRIDDASQPAEVFAFADAVHQDFSNARFTEPHTVAYRRAGLVTGAGHFRHAKRANLAYLDGHADALEPPDGESTWARFGDADVVNLDTHDGAGTRFGFDTWTAR